MKMPLPMRRWEDQFPPAEKRRMRKGMYILPSLFTAANIGAGYYALSQTVLGTAQDFWHFDHAALAIGVAVVADGLDGRIARMTNTASAFGREFDSLADVITFGVAPAVLAWMWGFEFRPGPAWWHRRSIFCAGNRSSIFPWRRFGLDCCWWWDFLWSVPGVFTVSRI